MVVAVQHAVQHDGCGLGASGGWSVYVRRPVGEVSAAGTALTLGIREAIDRNSQRVIADAVTITTSALKGTGGSARRNRARHAGQRRRFLATAANSRRPQPTPGRALRRFLRAGGAGVNY